VSSRPARRPPCQCGMADRTTRWMPVCRRLVAVKSTSTSTSPVTTSMSSSGQPASIAGSRAALSKPITASSLDELSRIRRIAARSSSLVGNTVEIAVKSNQTRSGVRSARIEATSSSSRIEASNHGSSEESRAAAREGRSTPRGALQSPSQCRRMRRVDRVAKRATMQRIRPAPVGGSCSPRPRRHQAARDPKRSGNAP